MPFMPYHLHDSMTIHRLLASALLALAILVAGCSGSDATRSANADADFPNHSVRQIHQQIVLATDTLSGYTADARLVVDAPQRSGQFSAKVHQRRSDSLFMSLSPGFGVEAARMLVTPDSFFVYDRINQKLSYGSVEAAQQYVPLPVSSEDIFENMLGILAPDPSRSWQVEADDEHYYLTDASGRHRYTVDPTHWRVIRYEERTADGELVETREFSEFTTFGNVYIPRRLTLRRPLDEASASLYYQKLTLNPETLSFNLEVGRNVERIPLSGAR